MPHTNESLPSINIDQLVNIEELEERLEMTSLSALSDAVLDDCRCRRCCCNETEVEAN